MNYKHYILKEDFNMEEKTINVEFEEVESEDLTWYEEFFEKAKAKYNATKDWCKDNKEMICVFGPVIVGSCIEIMKMLTKRSIVNEERRLKDNYIYDSSNRHYYELVRKPKSYEWVEIDERRSLGEPLGEILQDMRLLK